MLTAEQCRELLEEDMADNELIELRNALYVISGLAFEIYWTERNSGSKNPLGLLSK